MTGLEMLAIGATIAGSAVSAAGTIAAGKAAQQSADYEAAQLDINAKEEQAAAQRDAQQYKDRKELALSSLQAQSAASGFSATDPTTLAIADEIERYGTVQEQMAQYGGKSRRRGLQDQATGRRLEGKAARKGSMYSAAGTILGGIGSSISRIPGSGPSTGSLRYG
jgi:hypothetical protein